MFYSPVDVRRALSSAESTESSAADSPLTQVLIAKEQDKTISIDLETTTKTSAADLPISITMDGLTKASKYLILSAGPGVDLPFMVDGVTYSRTRPFVMDGRRRLGVASHLPRTVQHQAKPIEICVAVFSRLLPDGAADSTSRQSLSKPSPCRLVEWKGHESIPNRRKLWALLIGFSQAPNDSVVPLEFAHEDAMNFARFLQLDHKGKLPGKSHFDDIEIRLLVSAPGMDSDALNGSPKIKILQKELGDERFRIIYPHGRERYDALVRNALSEILSLINDPNRVNRADWEDEILVYFSGHGFSRYSEGGVPHMRVGLMTPDTNQDFDDAVVWVDEDLMVRLRNSNLVSLIVIDACSSDMRDDVQGLSAEATQLKIPPIYEDAGVHGSTQLQILLGSELGKYSYEQSDYGIDDFVPNVALWPSKLRTKGSGVFSLGLLTSLLCREAAGRKGSYTFATSSDFLKDHFFHESNSKWQTGIRPKLEDMMNKLHPPRTFVVPAPTYIGFPGGDIARTDLRSMSPAAPICSLSK
jgi:hypothetical protein